MADVKTLAVSDLLLMFRPVTGALILSDHPSNPSYLAGNSVPSSRQKRKRLRSDEAVESSSANFDCPEKSRVLAPLKHSVLLIGRVDLWNGVGARRSQCSKSDCLLFMDGKDSVCCDVLPFNLEMIGRRVRVLAWNFIPSKSGGGLLEIIKWEFAEIPLCSGSKATVPGYFPLDSSIDILPVDDTLLLWQSRAGRNRVCGLLNSISAVFDVPCTLQSRTSDGITGERLDCLKGFLAEFLVCGCSECVIEMLPGHISRDEVTSTVVYACGCAVKWRPVFAKLVGSFMSIIGLKKKLVLVDGKTIPVSVFTSETCIRLYRKEQDVSWEDSLTRKMATKKGFIGGYTGVVTGVFMQGMVVELDDKVWLVLTDQASIPHALRVGAIVVVRNAHLIFPKFSWSKLFLLGACAKTVMVVKRFSARATQCHFRSRTDSLLGKFVGSLSFAAKFWTLATVSSFRVKFSRILSEKEILGSKNREGLVQIYARLCLPDHLSLHPYSLFEEFCFHTSCCVWDDPDIGLTKLASPICYICDHLVSKRVSQLTCKIPKSIEKNKDTTFLLQECTSYGWFERRIISSKDIGITLLGRLQISSSGKLQFVDSTGGIDAVVPDLQVHTNDDIIYVVDNYNLIVEGPPVQTLEMEPKENDLCRNIFQHSATKGKLSLTIYVHFFLKSTFHVGYSVHLPAQEHELDNANDQLPAKFHLLFVKHKFPPGYNVPACPKISNITRLHAEAILLPFCLLLPGESRAFPIGEQRKESTEHPTNIHSEGKVDRHGLSIDGSNVSSESSSSNRLHDYKFRLGFGDTTPDSCPNFIFPEQYGDVCHQIFESKAGNTGFPLDVICHFNSKSFKSALSFVPGSIPSTGDCSSNDIIPKTLKGENVLLEFDPGSFMQFQLLHIGAYYMISCRQDTAECQLDDITQHSSCAEVPITSAHRLWSPSFSSFPLQSQIESSFSFVSVSLEPFLDPIFLIMNQVPLRCFTKNRLIYQRFKSQQIPSGMFDLNLYLPSDKLKFLRQILTFVEDSTSDPSATFKEFRKHVAGNFTRKTLSSVNHITHFLHGEHMSVSGEILDIHRLGCCSVASDPFRRCCPGGKSWLTFLLGDRTGICIHVNDGSQMIKIYGTLDVQKCPSGIGPGVIATFYSVLMKRRQVFLLTPATFIVINAIKEVDYRYGAKCLKFHVEDRSFGPPSTIFSSFISNSFHSEGSNLVKIHGRVVAVYGLALEKRPKKYIGSMYYQKTMNPTVTIPLAGFIFDDGSRTCCCWATSERAETLLRLHETASEVFVVKPTHSGHGEPLSTIGQILGKIIKKHLKIFMKNCTLSSADGFSCLDLSFSSGLNKTFSNSDQRLLKFIILNACLGSRLLMLTGCFMDCDTLEGINKYMDMQIGAFPHHHFLIKEACHLDPLADARSIFQKLV